MQAVRSIEKKHSYRTFGSVTYGRSFTSMPYRYGYQGSEKDNEIAGTGNDYTTHYRGLDTRLGRWFNLDPVQKSYESPYTSMSNNPIRDFDWLGDDLDVGTNKESKSDLKSLAKGKNKSYINVDDKTGKVTLDFGSKTAAEVSKILKKDEGLNLVNDLVKSDKKFLYEATDMFLGKNEDGMKMGRPLYLENDKIVNASDKGTDSNGGHTYLPKEGYNGQVAIHKDATYDELSGSGMIVKKPRSALVFHELAENYERTNNGVSYKGDAKANGAHQLSIDREKKWWNVSNEPGAVRNPYAPKPSRAQMQDLSKRLNEYVSPDAK